MIGFIDEIIKKSGLKPQEIQYQYVNFSGKAIYLQGYIEILQFSPESIVFKLKGALRFYIEGVDLRVLDMDEEGVMVVGKILVVEAK